MPTYETPAGIVTADSARQRHADGDYGKFRSQVVMALRDILGRHDSDATILLVAHGGTIGTIFRVLLGSDAFTVNVGNTTLHSLTWDDGLWHLEYIDRWDHLRNV